MIAKTAMRCQRCGGPIRKGEQIRSTAKGTCHLPGECRRVNVLKQRSKRPKSLAA